MGRSNGLWSAGCYGFGILEPFRRPTTTEICPLVASKHDDLKSLGCAVQNLLHRFEPSIVGENESVIENDR
jgi:hypothetical protein